MNIKVILFIVLALAISAAKNLRKEKSEGNGTTTPIIGLLLVKKLYFNILIKKIN